MKWRKVRESLIKCAVVWIVLLMTSHHVKLKVVSLQEGELGLWVRATVTSPKGQIVATPESGPLDQQGFPVREYTITIAGPIPIGSVSGMAREKAEELMKGILPELLNEKEYESASKYGSPISIMLADVDGDGQEEAIAVISLFWDGIIGVLRKQGEGYVLWDRIDCSRQPVVRTFDLLGNGKQALIIESGRGGGTGMDYRGVEVYQWDGEKFAKIWEGGTEGHDFATSLYTRSVKAKVQIIDSNQDGIREIVRMGEVYQGQWADPFAKDSKSAVELEINPFTIEAPPLANLVERVKTAIFRKRDVYELEWGYEAIYRFREIFFWNEATKKYEGREFVKRISESFERIMFDK